MDTELAVPPFQKYARLRAFHYPGSHSDYAITLIVVNCENWMRAEDQKLNINLEWPYIGVY